MFREGQSESGKGDYHYNIHTQLDKPRLYASANQYSELMNEIIVGGAEYPGGSQENYVRSFLEAELRFLTRVKEEGYAGIDGSAGEILKFARGWNVISDEIDGTICAETRTFAVAVSHGSTPFDEHEPVIAQVRTRAEDKFKEEERSDPKYREKVEALFTEYSEIAKEARGIEMKHDQAHTLDPSDFELYDKFRNLQGKVQLLPTMIFINHFFDNGDLKWLWNINEEDTVETLKNNYRDGRVGDYEDAHW